MATKKARPSPSTTIDGKKRCRWAMNDPLMRAYHDEEWGVPERDGRALWEKLMLDGFQAGLSWITVLRKRDAFRKAFAGFDPKRVSKFTKTDVTKLLKNEGIIRSRAKIESTIEGAKIYVAMENEGEPFADYAWSFVDGKPIVNKGITIPALTPLSEKISKDLKTRGFKFVGPTIVYAWMQACGLVNDHAKDCFCRETKRKK